MITVIAAKTLYKFSNTQIIVPKDIASKISKWGKEKLKESDVYTDPEDPTLGREDDFHITVKYGLHTSNAEEVKKAIANFGSFDVKLGKVSLFEREDYHVLKIDVESKRLHELNKLIESKLETTTKFPDYKPHVTISYIKKGTCKNLLDNTDFAGYNWSVDSLDFCNRGGRKTKINFA